MENKENYLALREKYDELEVQSSNILKEQKTTLEELQRVCPHNDTSAPFLDALYTWSQAKACKCCKKLLYLDSSDNVWK